jgi:ComF family protein
LEGVAIPGRLRDALLDLLFPPRCGSCNRPGAWLCADCLAGIDWIRPPLCGHCGEPIAGGSRCPRRWQHPALLDGLRSAAWHAGPLRAAIYRYKYRGRRVLAGPLGAVLAQVWRRDPPPVDLLLPVPLHARRLRERGFNQATLLARELSRAAGVRVEDGFLQRVRPTPPQVELNAAERPANVEGAFAYTGPPLHGHAVCLIDDICTTGATLQACAAALREAGADSIWGYTLARPHWEASLRPGAGG